MIDLHCHILPGLDDGPADDDEALQLGRELAAAGVRTVAATPHFRDDYPAVKLEELAARCASLAAALNVDLEIVPASELDLVRALECTDDELRLASFDQRGSDILLETPYGPLTTSFEDHLFELSVRNYRVLLAHPERNPTFQQEPRRLAELVRRGVLLQVTGGSLLSPRPRSRSRQLARSLVADRVAHVLASDAHGPSGPRRDTLDLALEEARTLAGSYADWMVEDAPRAILAGEPLPASPAAAVGQPGGLLRRLTRRGRG